MDASDSSGTGAAAAERKLVAVVACEVSAPTATNAEPAIGQPDQQLADLLSRVEAEVARHGGTVVEAIGGMLLAVYGVPRTHEDDAERAVRTALVVRAGLGAGVREAGRLRAGIAFGEAVIRPGEPADGRRREVAGEVVATALAVMTAAPPGAVLVTATTLRATERAISYAPAQLLRLAGTSEPVAAWEALAPRPRSGRAPPPVLGVGLVGREGELAALMGRYLRGAGRAGKGGGRNP